MTAHRSTPTSSSPPLDIGEVVARTGVKPSTLHVWEREGLLAPVARAGLRRQYAADAVERVAVIRLLQETGFTLAEIGEVVAADAFESPDGDEPAPGAALLHRKLAELREQRATLDRAITGIEHALACEAPSPLSCEGFRAHLPSMLPPGDERPPKP